MPARRRAAFSANACLGLVALAVGALLLWHRAIPDVEGVMGLLESVLPWFALVILFFGVLAAVRRSAFIGVGALVSAIVWAAVFVPQLMPEENSGRASVTVISENLDAGNGDPAATVRAIADRHPDVIALQELTSATSPVVVKALEGRYPHHVLVGTVGVWSTLPLTGEQSLTLGLGWKRALRVDVVTRAGVVRLYSLHAASLRPGEFRQRDEMLDNLGRTLRADDAKRLIALGDFNAASTDRAFTELLSTVHEPHTSSFGFGFTWPAALPVARVDHVLERGLTVVSSRVLPANGSDHRGIEVGLR
ncbi:endonuclease/exonuclease/phosphatase family protein [Gryllotalpicola ginsengisoli]|uniref:endonuclease/exonuclease/phosphatase family protein n=1 Tax=Gryllotalpicola ginsengisoli TaxID=444608 RepID=UPI00138ADC02|nr:endonuclease/exonuclease/phosphatase family protein [Gryllotalpicola ginsengisoli]